MSTAKYYPNLLFTNFLNFADFRKNSAWNGLRSKSGSLKRNVGRGEIAPKTGLRVTLPDGRVIAHPKASDTFIDTLLAIGIDRVRPLGVKFCKIPIISNTRDKKYGKAQHDVGDGWMILTHSSTADKKKMPDKIAKALNLNMKVEII